MEKETDAKPVAGTVITPGTFRLQYLGIVSLANIMNFSLLWTTEAFFRAND
jgi:hypothetical protein